MTLRSFAQAVGFTRSNVAGFKTDLKFLEEEGALKVKQGGFIAHSTYHPKIVYVYDWEKIRSHFRTKITIPTDSEPEHYYDEKDRTEEKVENALSFCLSDRSCRYQFKSKTPLPYPLCSATRKCRQRFGARLSKDRAKHLVRELYAPDERALFFNC